MARLVLLADPAVIASRPSWRLGMVIDVFEDGTEFSKEALLSQPVLDVPGMGVEEAREKFCADGVPAEARKALAEAVAARDALFAVPPDDRDAKALNDAMVAIETARAATRGHPRRAVCVDLWAAAPHLVATAEASRACLDACAEEAKTAAKSAVLSELAFQKGRDLTPEEIATPTKDIVASLTAGAEMAREFKDEGAAKIFDERKAAILAASADARRAVEGEALASVPVPDVVTVRADEIDRFLAPVKA